MFNPIGMIDHLEQLHHHQLGRRYGGLLHHLGAAEEKSLEQGDAELLHPLELGLILDFLGQIGEGQVAMIRHEVLYAGLRRAAQVELDDMDVGEEPVPV